MPWPRARRVAAGGDRCSSRRRAGRSRLRGDLGAGRALAAHRSDLLLAWFRPRGLASILFALLVLEEGQLASGETFGAVVFLTVALSTLLHGATAYPLAKRYGRFVAGLARDRHPEHEPAMELPTRARAWRAHQIPGDGP